MTQTTPAPGISVVVCAYNRAGILRECLQRLAAQTADPAAYEVVVVDNNSTDNTRAVAEEFARRHPGIRCCAEARQGLSHARNRGCAEAAFDRIAFIDDDAFAAPDWVERLSRCFDETDADVVGGRVSLLLRAPLPDWCGPFFRGFLGELDMGPGRATLETGQTLNGGNLAFRRAALEACNGFAGGLGRHAGDLLAMEETLLISRLMAAGRKVVFDHDAHVEHVIGPERANWDYLRRVFEGHGRSLSKLDPGALLALRLRRLPGIRATGLARFCTKRAVFRALPVQSSWFARLRVRLIDLVCLTGAFCEALMTRLFQRDPYTRRAAEAKLITIRSMVRSRGATPAVCG